MRLRGNFVSPCYRFATGALMATLCLGSPAGSLACAHVIESSPASYVENGATPIGLGDLRAQMPGPNPVSLSPFGSQTTLADCVLGGTYGKKSRFIGFEDGQDLTSITMFDGAGQPRQAVGIVTESMPLPKYTTELNAERTLQGQGSWGTAKSDVVSVLTAGSGGCGPVYITCVRTEIPAKCGSGDIRMLHMGTVFTATASPVQAHAEMMQIRDIMEGDIFDPIYHYYIYPDADIVLPSGAILPRTTSPYALCKDKLGERPSTTGLSDPCDKAVAALLGCIYDAKCDAARALERARRSTISTAVGGVSSIGGAILACAGPVGWVVLAGAGITALGSWYFYDSTISTIENCEDAKAALERIPSCWKTFWADTEDCI